ncbi:rRNA-processing protein Efg1 [archaeon]|nr:MAG: rRNA-processing protein Efg1 [archaeon]
MPSNQKKIRDLQRLLKSKADSLDEAAKTALLNKIAQVEQSKQAHVESEKRKKHMEKYQMVRFFERKKVTRMLLNLEKKMKPGSDKALEEEKAELYEKLTYIM